MAPGKELTICSTSPDVLAKQVLAQYSSKVPKSKKDIAKSVILYGEFYKGFDYMRETFKSETSSSIIIRGNIGCGKNTLIQQALQYSKVAKSIYLNPDIYTDDISALKRVAEELGLNLKPSVQELLENIEEASRKFENKIVIVLQNFEKFCRQKQSLLYSLTHLTQHGHNITLIGLTIHLDCTDNLEKRVRSRLNALVYELHPPYTNKKEYIEFASLLLGGYDLSSEPAIKQALERIYNGNKAIIALKSYLLSICSWSEDGELTLTANGVSSFDPRCDPKPLENRFGWLTLPEQKLLKIAVSYCNANDICEFSLKDLEKFEPLEGSHDFENKNQQILRSTRTLVLSNFFIPLKHNQMISQETEFVLGISPIELKAVIKRNPEFQRLNNQWKKWRI